MRETDARDVFDIEDLEQEFENLLQQLDYYRHFVVETGKKRLREIDILSRLNQEQKKTKENLKYRIALEILVNEITASFIEDSGVTLAQKIKIALGKTGEFYSVDRSFLMLKEGKSTLAGELYEWCADDIRDQVKEMLDLFPQSYLGLIDTIFHDGVFRFEETAILQNTALDEFFRSRGIKSLIALPLVFEDSIIGYIGYISVLRRRQWKDEDVIVLKTLAGILVSAIHRDTIEAERNKLEEQLQIKQRIDSLGTLAGGIAHDLNNLLVAIIGNVDLLKAKAGNLPEDMREYIDDALDASKHAANFIRDIQAFSKGLVRGKSTVDIYDIASNVLNIIDRTTSKLIEKELAIEPGVFYVTTSEDLLHQALFNLAINAVHAIEERDDQQANFIRFGAENYVAGVRDKTGLRPGEYIHILVEDTGIGMSEQIKARAFDPLFTTRRSSGKGQGLGLAMVYNIITKNHEGAVEIESQEGVGTVFHVYLPVAHDIERDGYEEEVECPNGTETILVIDDDESVVNFARECLEHFGYSVITALDGMDGITKFIEQQSDIHIILLDITMPKMSGGMVMKEILDVRPDSKVIICSGHSEEDMAEFAQATGYLAKPFDMHTLANTVRIALDK